MKQTVNQDSWLLLQIKPCNLLSFGPDTPGLELENLNIFIGPNGAGKSNLIEAISLMRATPISSQTTSNGIFLVSSGVAVEPRIGSGKVRRAGLLQ